MVSVDVKHHVYHGNQLKSLVTMSRVTYFIKRAYKGSCLSFNTVKLNYGDDLENTHMGHGTGGSKLGQGRHFWK